MSDKIKFNVVGIDPATGKMVEGEVEMDVDDPRAKFITASNDNIRFSIRKELVNPLDVKIDVSRMMQEIERLTAAGVGRDLVPTSVYTPPGRDWRDYLPIADQSAIRFGSNDDLRKLAEMARSIARRHHDTI